MKPWQYAAIAIEDELHPWPAHCCVMLIEWGVGVDRSDHDQWLAV